MQEAAPSLEQLLALLKSQAASGRALPVESWNPSHCGEAGLEILSDGTWVHEGARITREALVRLFASVLRKDTDGQTYLVTPVEKIRIAVADAPFLAVRVDRDGRGDGQSLIFTTNVGDVAIAGPEHPIRFTFDAKTGEPRPYVLVRGRLEARILRAPYFELADWADKDGFVWSGGVRFAVGNVQ